MSCVTLPTSTRTDVSTSTELIPTEVPTTITGTPTLETSTISDEVCSTNTTVVPPTSTCSFETTTTVITTPGETTVTSTTTTIESLHFTTDFQTFFSTSCSDTTPPPTTPPTSPTNNPPPVTNTTTSTTIGQDGQPTVTTITETFTPTPQPTTQPDSSSNDSGTNVGAIAGGAIGGFVGLIALAMVLWFFFKKSSQPTFDDLFDKHDDYTKHHHNHQDKPGPLDTEVTGNGTGYKYGILGNEAGHGANTVGHNNGGGVGGGGQEAGYQPHGPHNINDVGYNPTMNETGYNPHGHETGYNPSGNDTGYNPSGSDGGYHDAGSPYGSDNGNHHTRQHSLAPLLGAVGVAAAGSTAYAVTTSSSRPSTGGSGQPLIGESSSQQNPSGGQGYNQQGYGTHLNTYPPPQGQFSQNQGYYGGASDRTQGYGSGLSPNPSLGSSSWGGGGGSSPSQYSAQSMPLVAGAAAPGRSAPVAFDPDNRSGSPVSFQEPRVLQVINPDTSQGLSTSFGDNDGSALASASSPGRQTSPPLVDGKGRPVDLNGQMVPLVHLDGGAYEEPLVPPRQSTPAASGSGGSMPPAYSS